MSAIFASNPATVIICFSRVGTSAVPSKGFFMLQATDGKERKFTIEGLSMEKSDFPSVHQ